MLHGISLWALDAGVAEEEEYDLRLFLLEEEEEDSAVLEAGAVEVDDGREEEDDDLFLVSSFSGSGWMKTGNGKSREQLPSNTFSRRLSK